MENASQCRCQLRVGWGFFGLVDIIHSVVNRSLDGMQRTVFPAGLKSVKFLEFGIASKLLVVIRWLVQSRSNGYLLLVFVKCCNPLFKFGHEDWQLGLGK